MRCKLAWIKEKHILVFRFLHFITWNDSMFYFVEVVVNEVGLSKRKTLVKLFRKPCNKLTVHSMVMQMEKWNNLILLMLSNNQSIKKPINFHKSYNFFTIYSIIKYFKANAYIKHFQVRKNSLEWQNYAFFFLYILYIVTWINEMFYRRMPEWS